MSRQRMILRIALMALFGPIILFLSAGDLDWTMGWVFAAFTFAFTLFSRLQILHKNPDLIAERAGALRRDNVEPWDRIMVPLLGIALPTATVVLAGLDHRFGWSPEFPLWLQAGAYLPILLGAVLSQWAAVENAFFSAVVRIQEDRGQTVVTTGPYRFIRHPGYAGSLPYTVCLPVALGSVWAFLPSLTSLVLILVRTSLEDRTLLLKLPGYRDYAERTKRRIVPGIW